MNAALYYFFMFTSVLSTVMFLGMAAWYLRVERRERTRNAQRKADIADIMILFQTMRDVISQQKNLARDFNQELDRKMGLVKEVLAKSLEKNEKLYERQTDIQRQLDEVRAQLEGMQRQASYLKTPAAPQSAPSPAPARRPAAPPEEPVHIVQTAKAAPAPPQKAAQEERLAKTGITDAPYSVWFGLDFDSAPQQAEPEEEEEPLSSAPTEPEDPEAARNAFRALLNLPSAPPPEPAAGAAPRPANGTPVAVPLQQRVLEYSEAGMGVAEIARELGIGKGEVRLMLSLAKQKGP